MKLFDRRKKRVRYKLKKNNRNGLPRLTVDRTLKNIYAQIIDDKAGKTLCSFSTKSKDFKGEKTWNVKSAEIVGEELAKLAKKAKVEGVVFDKGAFKYHGRVKALADAARKGGLKF